MKGLNQMTDKQKIGFDLVDDMPDYSKSAEENEAISRKKYLEVYGKDYFDKENQDSKDNKNA